MYSFNFFFLIHNLWIWRNEMNKNYFLMEYSVTTTITGITNFNVLDTDVHHHQIYCCHHCCWKNYHRRYYNCILLKYHHINFECNKTTYGKRFVISFWLLCAYGINELFLFIIFCFCMLVNIQMLINCIYFTLLMYYHWCCHYDHNYHNVLMILC